MHPTISAFPNYQFYGGLVQDGANVLEASYGSSAYQVASNLFGTSAFLDVQHGYEVRENKSWRNYAEVNLICLLIARLLQGMLISPSSSR
jgi:senataxin